MSDWLDAEAHADRALEMYERGRWAEAEAELRKAISMNPDQAEWHFNLGLTLEMAGRDADALECYERAVELLPDQVDPLLAAAVTSNRLEKFPRAIELLDIILKLDPANEAAYAHKIEAHGRLGQHDDAETTFYLAQHALPEASAQCLAVMGESLMQRELFERAEWCLKEALRLEPNMPRLRARLAAVSASVGKSQRALQLYIQELREDPGNIETLLEYGLLLFDLGRLPEAAEKFRRVLEMEPANVEAHYELGQIALSTRRFEQAHLEFELVLKLDAQFPGIRQAMGETLLRRDRLEEAREFLVQECDQLLATLKEAESSPPGIPPANDQSSNEIPELKSISRQQAGDPSVDSDTSEHRSRGGLAGLAELLLQAGEPQRAAQILEHALTESKTAELFRQLALARFRAGDRNAGSAASRRALRLDPTCIRSIHNLALAAWQLGKLRIAAGWVQRGLAINRHDDGLRRLRIRVWLAAVQHSWTTLVFGQRNRTSRSGR